MPLAALMTVTVPAGQLLHALFRFCAEYFPLGQLKHFAIPVGEYSPGPHSSGIVKWINL